MTDRRDSHAAAIDSSEGVPSGNPQTIDDPRVIRDVRQYRSELEKGNRPQRQRLLARYPEIADELADCLDGLEFVQRVAPQLRKTSSGSPPHVDKKIGPAVALGDFTFTAILGGGGCNCSKVPD
jgi:hypothetical protein